MIRGIIGRKLGMTRLYDGSGRVRAVTVIEVGPNRVTQVRTTDRDGYEAVQIGFSGNRKRQNRPERGHLRAAQIDGEVLSMLQEFSADDYGEHQLGEVITVEQFEPGQYVDVRGTSKGRGWAGGVKRWGFHGGPKTHGQSDRHRAPGSVGAGTTPGKVWKGQKMAGHMGARNRSVLNLLVVQTDPNRNLLFVEGSVPGPNQGLVTVTPARKSALAGYEPPAPFEAAAETEAPIEPEAPESVSADAPTDDAPAEDAGASDDLSAATDEPESDEAPDASEAPSGDGATDEEATAEKTDEDAEKDAGSA